MTIPRPGTGGFFYGMIAPVGREYIPADSVPVSAAVRSDGLGQSTDLVGGDVSPPYEGMSVTLPYPE